MRKTELLDKYARDGDSRLLLARVLDQWQRAEQRGVPTHTGFLSPAEQAVSADLLMAAAPGQGILAGGYPDAERRLWAFLPDWLEEETWQQGEECPLCALEVETPLGDILLSQQGAQVVVLREVLPILLSQWEKVGRYPVRLTPIPLAQLRPVPGERKQIRATVASPRLDAVAAAGFSIPRSRAAELIRGGRVMVNHRPCGKADKAVEAGDVLTCRGLGKCVLREIGGTSKRGRTILELERYL